MPHQRVCEFWDSSRRTRKQTKPNISFLFKVAQQNCVFFKGGKSGVSGGEDPDCLGWHQQQQDANGIPSHSTSIIPLLTPRGPVSPKNRQGPLSAVTFQRFICARPLPKDANMCALEPWPLEHTLVWCFSAASRVQLFVCCGDLQAFFGKTARWNEKDRAKWD